MSDSKRIAKISLNQEIILKIKQEESRLKRDYDLLAEVNQNIITSDNNLKPVWFELKENLEWMIKIQEGLLRSTKKGLIIC